MDGYRYDRSALTVAEAHSEPFWLQGGGTRTRAGCILRLGRLSSTALGALGCLPCWEMTGFYLYRGECHYLSVKRRRSCFRERKETLTKSKNRLVDLDTAEATGFAEHGLL